MANDDDIELCRKFRRHVGKLTIEVNMWNFIVKPELHTSQHGFTLTLFHLDLMVMWSG